MASKTKADRGRSRVNLRLPTDLVEWAKGFAAGQNKTLTAVVKEYLSSLKRQSESGHVDQF